LTGACGLRLRYAAGAQVGLPAELAVAREGNYMEATIRFRGETHTLSREDILRAAEREVPGRITTYFVDINGRRFPPKQLIRSATGTRKPFNSANARSVLAHLGFHIDTVGPH
jgi:hypothetical protein